MQLEPVITAPITLPPLLDIGAVVVGAIYGATVATSRKAPLVGVLLMGIMLGFGGSIIRDILLNVAVNPLAHGRYMTTAVISAIVGALFGSRILRHKRIFYSMDALVTGMFVVIGAEKALIMHMPISSVIFIGTITAIGGGLIGDILLGQQADLMSRGPWSASVALVGAIWFTIVYKFGYVGLAEVTTVLVVLFFRGMALLRGWQAPTPEDLNPKTWVERTKR